MRATPLSALANRRAATGGATSVRSGVLLDLENLAALVHAGLQVEVVRTAQFAGILVFGVGRLLERVGGTAHATPRRRCFSSRNGHIGGPCRVVWSSSQSGRPGACGAGEMTNEAALITERACQS